MSDTERARIFALEHKVEALANGLRAFADIVSTLNAAMDNHAETLSLYNDTLLRLVQSVARLKLGAKP